MTNAVPIITLRCHYCSRFSHPKDFVNIGESVLMCWDCWEKHKVQVAAFNPPHECQGCKRTFDQLAADTPGGNVSMFPHWKDGTYQILCARCDAEYVQKRKDLYGDTRFGLERKLK